jgi:predicted acetyltransferase
MDQPCLQLIEPTARLREDFLALVEEYVQGGDQRERSTYAEAARDFEAYLGRLRDHAAGANTPTGWSPYRTYWLVRDGRRIVATSSLRTVSTEPVLYEIGHIGYGTRPSERGKGYATAVCRLTLGQAARLGFNRVLITCDADNVASARVIQKNGGVLENQVVSRQTGKLKNRYWIELAP